MTSRFLCLIAAGSLLAGCAAFAQENNTAPAPHQRRPIPPPTNLKVLPKDLTGPQVVDIMHHYAGDLGVECEYCHAKDPATGRPNFASDANPMKDRARVMIRMTNTINTEYLTQLTDPKPMNPVTCGTCHRGMSTPSVFVPERHQRPTGPPPDAAGGTPPSPPSH